MNHDNIKRHDRDIFDAQAKPDIFHSSSLAAIMHEKQQEWFATWIISHPMYRRELRILDIGSGGGFNTEWLGTFSDLTIGVDHSPARVKNAILRLPERNKIHFLLADGEMPPIKNKSIDIVFCAAILHHLPNYKIALDSYNRTLREGGIVIASEPCAFNPFAVIRRRFLPSKTHTPDEKPFRPKEIINEFKSNFDVIHYRRFYLFSVNSPLVEKLFGQKAGAVFFKIFSRIDKVLLKVPIIKELCWIICLVGHMKSK